MIYSKIAGFVFVATVLLPVSFLSAAELCVELSYTIKVNQDTKTSSIKCTISSMNSQNYFNLDYLMRKLADAPVVPVSSVSPSEVVESPAAGDAASAPVDARTDSPVEVPASTHSTSPDEPSATPAVSTVSTATAPASGAPVSAPAPFFADRKPLDRSDPVYKQIPKELSPSSAENDEFFKNRKPLDRSDPVYKQIPKELSPSSAENDEFFKNRKPLDRSDPVYKQIELATAWHDPGGFVEKRMGSQNDLWNLYTGTTDRTQVNRDALVAVGKQVDPSFDMSPGQYHAFMASWYKMDPNIPLGSALAAFKAAPPANTDTTVNNNNKGFDFNNVNWPLWIGGGSLALLALMILLERRRKRRDDDE